MSLIFAKAFCLMPCIGSGTPHEALAVSKHRQLDQLFNSLFGPFHKWNIKTSLHRPIVRGNHTCRWIPLTKGASNAKILYMSWHHYGNVVRRFKFGPGKTCLRQFCAGNHWRQWVHYCGFAALCHRRRHDDVGSHAHERTYLDYRRTSGWLLYRACSSQRGRPVWTT